MGTGVTNNQTGGKYCISIYLTKVPGESAPLSACSVPPFSPNIYSSTLVSGEGFIQTIAPENILG